MQKDGLRGLMKGFPLSRRNNNDVLCAYRSDGHLIAARVSGNLIDVMRSVPMTGLSFLFYGVTKSVSLHSPAACRLYC